MNIKFLIGFVWNAFYSTSTWIPHFSLLTIEFNLTSNTKDWLVVRHLKYCSWYLESPNNSHTNIPSDFRSQFFLILEIINGIRRVSLKSLSAVISLSILSIWNTFHLFFFRFHFCVNDADSDLILSIRNNWNLKVFYTNLLIQFWNIDKIIMINKK